MRELTWPLISFVSFVSACVRTGTDCAMCPCTVCASCDRAARAQPRGPLLSPGALACSGNYTGSSGTCTCAAGYAGIVSYSAISGLASGCFGVLLFCQPS